LKAFFATDYEFDPAALPYDREVLRMMGEARSAGRAVYIASASNEKIVRAIAEHLDCVDGWFASDDGRNLSSQAKANLLVERFGARGFDYIGNHHDDMAVWAQARRGFAIRGNGRLTRLLSRELPAVEHLPWTKPGFSVWLRMLRVHQYLKNALVFLPLLTSHSFDAHSILLSISAVIAFSLSASAVYILNDLVDLDADRGHPSKRTRPLAAGEVDLLAALLAVPVLIGTSLALALFVSLPFLVVILGYLALTTAYSFWLKRKMLVDVVVLALLYTSRVVGGAVAISVPVSEWILAFSLFAFVALALIKRHTELSVRLDRNLPNPSNRNYEVGDLGVITALAAASAMNAVTVFALYIASDTVQRLYTRPQLLWLVCPILIYWLGRCLMMAQRRLLDDDPIVFALKDRISRLTIVTICLIVVAAI
jgi:4-hydroxybenzoate polyprenyltransferase